MYEPKNSQLQLLILSYAYIRWGYLRLSTVTSRRLTRHEKSHRLILIKDIHQFLSVLHSFIRERSIISIPPLFPGAFLILYSVKDCPAKTTTVRAVSSKPRLNLIRPKLILKSKNDLQIRVEKPKFASSRKRTTKPSGINPRAWTVQKLMKF